MSYGVKLIFNCIHPKVEIRLVAFTYPSLNDLKIYFHMKPFLLPDASTKIFTRFFSLCNIQIFSSRNYMNQILLKCSLDCI